MGWRISCVLLVISSPSSLFIIVFGCLLSFPLDGLVVCLLLVGCAGDNGVVGESHQHLGEVGFFCFGLWFRSFGNFSFERRNR